MPKSRYYYNLQTCKFEKTPFPFWSILAYMAALVSSGLVLAVTALIIFNNYYESEIEKSLSKENEDLSKYLAVLSRDVNDSQRAIARLKETDGFLFQRIYEADPVSFYSDRQSYLREKEDLILGDFSDFKNFYHTTLNKANKKNTEADIRSFILVNNWINNTKKLEVDHMPSIQPLDNAELTKLASGFGMRINPFHKGRYLHEGIDFAATRGTEIKATATGKVSVIKKSELQAGYGNYLEIDHGNGYVTRYAHLEDIFVKQGQKVSKVEVIATVGMSGGATAPHLHYEIIYRGNKINPINYLIEEMDEKSFEILKKLSSMENQALD